MKLFEFFQELSAQHEQLKKRIHGFRIPLSPAGQRIMAVVYFSIPIVSGYYIMQWAIGKAEARVPQQRQQAVHSPQYHQVQQQKQALQKVLDESKEKKDQTAAAQGSS